VNIVGATATVSISITAQSVGLWIQPQWAAKGGYDKTLHGYDNIVAGGASVLIDYVVPSGKTLYITDVSFARISDQGPVYLWIYDYTHSVTVFTVAAMQGGAIILNTPKVFPGGTEIWVYIQNPGTTDSDFEVTVGGFEI